MLWLASAVRRAGKLTRFRHSKRWQVNGFFLHCLGGGAWPFLVGGAIPSNDVEVRLDVEIPTPRYKCLDTDIEVSDRC